ncbi:replicative DNA helicase [candidate division LCP-89 bacterium B3_LCP]|uniref:Replicative DNA helicase n=1 Tax=candidate division LCP-89 bacterium B3_LCP TaxID=2012998 RepID=A0A532V0F4_UNCL8|nr:MAG: replicative DNA helicase [candidate division LCP-89 bacterium B3_LCP]
MAVLGAVMLDQSAAARVFEVLDDTCFFKDSHRLIFQAALKLYQRNDPIDLMTVTETLNAQKSLDEIGGAEYLAELVGRVASPANAEHHAHIVLRKSLLRKMIHTCTRAIDLCYSEPDEVDYLLDQTENEIFHLMQFHKTGGFQPLGPLMMQTHERLENVRGGPEGVTGVASGFRDMDKLTSGWQDGDMIVLAGRPSMGKTAFGLAIARNAAVDYKTPVGFFSLEMANQQLALRIMCAEAEVNSAKVRSGTLEENKWSRLSTKMGKLFDAAFFIDDTPALTPMELRARARQLKTAHDVGLIVVDYIGLMELPHKKIESQQQKIAEISRSLKALAKDLSVPVIILSQLSRAVETRTGDKRPILSDLRDSGAIEQDADVVLFIYRPGLYKQTSMSGDEVDESHTEIIVAKQRNGPLGTAELRFDLQTGRFWNLDHVHQSTLNGAVDGHPF